MTYNIIPGMTNGAFLFFKPLVSLLVKMDSFLCLFVFRSKAWRSKLTSQTWGHWGQ